MKDASDEGAVLLERDREVRALREAVESACGGNGGAVAIEGPAGIGKTSLLAYARTCAQEGGMRVVTARGAELECGFPYGVVRQLFESFLFTVEPTERSAWLTRTTEMGRKMFGRSTDETAEPAEEFALLHSLYWMCVNIADERPLLMVLDDAQWADPPSLKFVEFTCRRVEQLPFLFLVATRLPDRQSPSSLSALLADPAASVLHPAPLSSVAVDCVLRTRIDPDPDAEFVRACLEVTSGNPFLLTELVHEMLDERLNATADAARRVRALGPRGVVRVVLLRLRRLSGDARQLAAALSVASDGMAFRDIAEIAGLDDRAAADALAGLQSSEIVDARSGLHFTHPVVRTAIHDDLPVIERSAIHLQAARLHAARGHPVAEIAAHLVEVIPGEDAWIATTLRQAAAEAFAVGDFRAAERLLARALRELVSDELRAELLAELGRAEARTGNPDAVGHLHRAVVTIADRGLSAGVSVELANVLKFSTRPTEAADVLLDALARLNSPSSELARRIHAELIGIRFITPVHHERARAELAHLSLPIGEPRDLLDSFLLAAAAFDAVATLRPVSEVVALGRRALTGAVVPHDPALGGQALVVASAALIWAEDFDFVYERYSRALADAHAAGSALAVGNNSTMRAMCCYRAGRLLEAESDAATVLELAPEAGGLQTLMAPAVAYAVLAGIERGANLDELRSIAENAALDGAAQQLPYTQLSWARGELYLVRGDYERALAHFLDCDRAEPGFGGDNPAMVPWREGAAIAHHRLGSVQTARDMAAEAVRRAQEFGAPRALGSSLRGAALVAEGRERIDGLREAVDALEHAHSPLELARVKCDLGAVLRAAGLRTEAQVELEKAHRLAASIGAVRIASRAAEELNAAGVRPRREPALGLSALTPSERRIAELAESGKTNREIAQTLFVTEKTVETHLAHVYDKLGVRSRRKLSDVLGQHTAA
jgi:DNA-binding CsgD family transcriptional regulator